MNKKMSTKIPYDYNVEHVADINLDIKNDKKIFGFWLYLMSDCVLFATLFATYIVLKDNTANGPSAKDIFELEGLGKVFLETFLLLLSSMTYNMVTLNLYKKNKKNTNIWLSITCFLGFCFIFLEFYEFYCLIIENYKPNRSAFLSSFFTLVAAHGIHVFSGIIWILVMIIHVSFYGLTYINVIRLQCLGLFWHFLDLIWIFVFTIVYLIGVI